jgi:IclR family pca regulon transcriptional regulator
MGAREKSEVADPVTPSGDRYRVDAAARAIDLLSVLAEEDAPQRLKDLTDRLGWNKTTIYRLLRTLQERGAVREILQHGYVLGPRTITIGQAALRALELPQIARPHLERLHDDTAETVNLAVLDEDRILIVERVEGKEILGLRLRMGSTLPAYCTSVGLVLLAGLTDEEVRRRLAATRFEPRGPKSMRSTEQVVERLQLLRQQGFAINDEELAAGHRAVAAPVWGHEGKVVAALNISVPAARRSRRDLISKLVPALQATAELISAELGAAPDARYGTASA